MLRKMRDFFERTFCRKPRLPPKNREEIRRLLEERAKLLNSLREFEKSIKPNAILSPEIVSERERLLNKIEKIVKKLKELGYVFPKK